MTLLGASILFNKGTNVHNQLRLICSGSCKSVKKVNEITNIHNLDDEFDDLLKALDEIYGLGNTQLNREQLAAFLLRYSDKIYLEFNKCNNIIDEQEQREANVYDLKN